LASGDTTVDTIYSMLDGRSTAGQVGDALGSSNVGRDHPAVAAVHFARELVLLYKKAVSAGWTEPPMQPLDQVDALVNLGEAATALVQRASTSANSTSSDRPTSNTGHGLFMPIPKGTDSELAVSLEPSRLWSLQQGEFINSPNNMAKRGSVSHAQLGAAIKAAVPDYAREGAAEVFRLSQLNDGNGTGSASMAFVYSPGTLVETVKNGAFAHAPILAHKKHSRAVKRHSTDKVGGTEGKRLDEPGVQSDIATVHLAMMTGNLRPAYAALVRIYGGKTPDAKRSLNKESDSQGRWGDPSARADIEDMLKELDLFVAWAWGCGGCVFSLTEEAPGISAKSDPGFYAYFKASRKTCNEENAKTALLDYWDKIYFFGFKPRREDDAVDVTIDVPSLESRAIVNSREPLASGQLVMETTKACLDDLLLAQHGVTLKQLGKRAAASTADDGDDDDGSPAPASKRAKKKEKAAKAKSEAKAKADKSKEKEEASKKEQAKKAAEKRADDQRAAARATAAAAAGAAGAGAGGSNFQATLAPLPRHTIALLKDVTSYANESLIASKCNGDWPCVYGLGGFCKPRPLPGNPSAAAQPCKRCATKATWGEHPKSVVIKALSALLPKIDGSALCPDNSTLLTAFVKEACKELGK